MIMKKVTNLVNPIFFSMSFAVCGMAGLSWCESESVMTRTRATQSESKQVGKAPLYGANCARQPCDNGPGGCLEK